jgi:hypothetical protein
MGTVTGLTAAAMEAIRDGSIVGVDVIADELIITYFDGNTENLGNIRGPAGTDGNDGTNGLTPELRATSTSSVTIGTGSKTFALSPDINVPFPVGSVVRVTGASAANYMVGTVTASSASSVTIDVTETGGSGTLASWTLTIGAFGLPQGGKAVRRFIVNSFTHSSTSYAVISNATERTNLTGTVVKSSAATKLLLRVDATAELTSPSPAQLIYMGLRITPNGGAAVDYDVGRVRFLAGTHRFIIVGNSEISGLAANTYTVEPIVRVSSGSTVLSFFNDDAISWSVQEVA